MGMRDGRTRYLDAKRSAGEVRKVNERLGYQLEMMIYRSAVLGIF